MEKVKQLGILSSKKNRRSLIIIIVSLVVAAGAFGYGVSQLSASKGYESISYSNDSTIFPADAYEVSFSYYLDGSNGTTVAAKRKELQNLYSNSLNTIYQLLDNTESYDSIVNLNYLNTHLNEEIIVGETLYNYLKDAYNKSNEVNSPYSIFAGPVYSIWNKGLAIYDNELAISYDPVYGLVNKETLINNCVLYTNDRTHCDISFNDATKTLKVTVSNTLLEILDENNFNLLDFNVLKDGYALEYLSNIFINKNYTKGYLYSRNCALSLGNNALKDNNEYNFITKNSSSDILTLPIIMNNKSCFSLMNSIAISNDELNHTYYVVDGSNVIYRHEYIDCKTGYSNDVTLSSMIVSESNKLYDVMYQNLQIFTTSKENALNKISNSSDIIITSFMDNCNKAYGNYDFSLDELYSSYEYIKL